MQSGLLFVLSWLGFSVFFYAIYLLIQSEWTFGIILAILSSLAIYFSMKLSDKESKAEETGEKKENFIEVETNTKKNDFELEELKSQKTSEKNHLEDKDLTQGFKEEEQNRQDLVEKDNLELVIEEDSLQVEAEESPWELSLSNEELNLILNPLIEEMMQEKMFMENEHFLLSKEELNDKYLIQEKIHRYQFHPVPLVAVVYNQDIKQFQIVMGLTRDKMDYIAILPQQYRDAMQKIYKDLYNVKAYIEQGPYRIVSEDFEDAIHPEADFHLRLRFYFQQK